MLMSRLRTHTHTDGNVKVEQYSAVAESTIICIEWSNVSYKHDIFIKKLRTLESHPATV